MLPAPIAWSESPTPFSLRPATDPRGGVVEHQSRVTLRLTRHLVATGRVIVPDGPDACLDHRTVKFSRLTAGGWWRGLKQKPTDPDGSYRIRLPDEEGVYRVFVKEQPRGDDLCLADFSRNRRHRHP